MYKAIGEVYVAKDEKVVVVEDSNTGEHKHITRSFARKLRAVKPEYLAPVSNRLPRFPDEIIDRSYAAEPKVVAEIGRTKFLFTDGIERVNSRNGKFGRALIEDKNFKMCYNLMQDRTIILEFVSANGYEKIVLGEFVRQARKAGYKKISVPVIGGKEAVMYKLAGFETGQYDFCDYESLNKCWMYKEL